jgi:predicted negative regulator of RcsB-dependent stress response
VQSRLARLLTDAGKPAEALKALGEKPQTAAALEARADALTALGKREEARAAYAQALAKLDVGAPQRRLVELKLTEVGGSPARTEGRNP